MSPNMDMIVCQTQCESNTLTGWKIETVIRLIQCFPYVSNHVEDPGYFHEVMILLDLSGHETHKSANCK